MFIILCLGWGREADVVALLQLSVSEEGGSQCAQSPRESLAILPRMGVGGGGERPGSTCEGAEPGPTKEC